MFVLLTLMVTAVTGEYHLITHHKTMEAGSTTYFCLILDALEYRVSEYTLDFLNVSIAYTLNKDNITTVENYEFLFEMRKSDREFRACQTVKAPQEPGNHKENLTVTLTYTSPDQHRTLEYTISYYKSLIVYKPDLIILIQPDKPMYLPGQTVKFRVMTMDYKLAAKTDNYEKISIESPDGNQVMQWLNLPAPNGLISLDMLLSSDPVLGVWNIYVMYGADTTVKSFIVDDYVLPKFEVTVTPPKFLLPTSKTIAGTVCAKYRYRKPVKGLLKLDVCNGKHFYTPYGDWRTCITLNAKIDGCYEFFIDAVDIKLGYRAYSTRAVLQINATVTEEQTGIKIQGSSKGPHLTLYPLTLRLEDDSSNFFKPGFPYKGRMPNNFTSDSSGIVHFTFTFFDDSPPVLSLRANAVESNSRYTTDMLNFRTFVPPAYLRLRKWFSPSNSYLYIPNVKTDIACEKELLLDVYYTANIDKNYKFMSIVNAGSAVVYTNQYSVNAGSGNYYMDIKSAENGHKYIKTDNATPSNLIGHFRLAVPISQKMSPSAKVLVFYLREDKEIVASTQSFYIKGCFRNKVSIRFEEEEVRPGADIKLNINASPNSTCFVGMMDKSVNLHSGSNHLTPYKVFEHVQRVGRPNICMSYMPEHIEYCNQKSPAGSDRKMSLPVGVDASQAFQDAEMWVNTNAVLNTRPCNNKLPKIEELTDCQEIDRETVTNTDSNADEADRIWTYFPETWLWNIVTVGDDGSFSFTSTIPDTITEWVGNSICTHGTDGVGVSEMTGVTTFQPFVVSITLPYSAIRGEVLPVLVTVNSYIRNCLKMEVHMKKTEGFQSTVASGLSRQFCLCDEDSESIKFHIVPSVIGEADIGVTAFSIENVNLCNNTLSQETEGVSDGVKKKLLIEAEGFPHVLTSGSYICVNDGAVDRETIAMTLPADLVPDSQRATVSVVGDIMGPTLSNMKKLLIMPSGCGEQNMASWSTNIYVSQYLSNTSQLTEELRVKAEGYMRVGYQQQLKYRHNDYSYSAWGETTYGNATGSLWLTAFVAKSMAKSSQYTFVDMENVLKSARWLLKHQEENGCFKQVGTLFSSNLKGGPESDNPAGLTAYTLIAFLDANLGEEFRSSIVKGFAGCLDKFPVDSTDTYTLTLMLYAYTLYNVKGPRRAEILQQLEQRKVKNGGLMYWKRDTEKKEIEQSLKYISPSAEVEMTAYVIMSRLLEGNDSFASVQPAIQWLTKQRNQYGGFSSTQDTVVAHQALAMFGSLTYSGDSSVTVEAKNDKLVHIFTITPSNRLVYQSTDVSPNDGPVQIKVTGKGCALVQVNMKYNIHKEEDESPAFDVKVKVYSSEPQTNNCAVRTLEVCASYLKSGGVSNMAIAEVKMPTGWIPKASTLKELMSSNRIQKFELDKNYVQVYFVELTRKVMCIDFEVEQEIEMTTKPSLVRVYDYLETKYSVTVDFEIKTTCHTKEEMSLDNESPDCTVVPCRKCPVCLETIGNEDLEKLTCDSSSVYRATVRGQDGIKIKDDLKDNSKTRLDLFLSYKMDTTHCKCPQITAGIEQKVLIFTDSMIINSETSEIWLQQGVTVLSYSLAYVKSISNPKMEFLKVTGSPVSSNPPWRAPHNKGWRCASM